MHNLITCNVEHFASGFLYSFARALAYVARDLSFVACVFMSPQYSEHANFSDAIQIITEQDKSINTNVLQRFVDYFLRPLDCYSTFLI